VAYGLAVGARPSLLFGAVILLVPVVQAWRERGDVAAAESRTASGSRPVAGRGPTNPDLGIGGSVWKVQQKDGSW
jgi:hypothetical protein